MVGVVLAKLGKVVTKDKDNAKARAGFLRTIDFMAIPNGVWTLYFKNKTLLMGTIFVSYTSSKKLIGPSLIAMTLMFAPN